MVPNSKTISVLPSQIDIPLSTSAFNTTTSPFSLFCSDVVLVLQNLGYFSGTFLPLTPYGSGALDELYPSIQNISIIIIHIFLFFFELGFVLSMPFFVFFFVGAGWVTYCGLVAPILYMVCLYLNGTEKSGRIVCSDPSILEGYDKKEDEVWLFVNGVAVGDHWLKNSLNRLSITFRRPIIGVHNPTYGIVFDVIQCLVQRDLSYNTPDVRQAYTCLKALLLNPSTKKVVLVAHSQGGIVASMALDWLYAELPSSALRKLEVYTFGCAANHFNNPTRSGSCIEDPQGDNREDPINTHINDESVLAKSAKIFFSSLITARREQDERVVPHIEHYANSGDFISRWGVLAFTRSSKHFHHRFIGRVFEQIGAQGHQFNQHYLDTMFPIDRRTSMVMDHNTFMDAQCTVDENLVTGKEQTAADVIDQAIGRQERYRIINSEHYGTSNLKEQYVSATKANVDRVKSMRVRELSRLWLYINGKVPVD